MIFPTHDHTHRENTARELLKRVAIVFDDETRPETTGVYCRRALGRLVEVEFFRPDQLASLPRTGFDLYLNVDDGLRYRWPSDLHPSAYWAIDTHIDFDWAFQKAKDFDFVFAAQKDGARRLREAGVAATWLPLACDPEVHGRQDVPPAYDVTFIGNLFPGPRSELVSLLQYNFSNCHVGRAYFQEMARVYSASKIVFNRSLAGDLNMRVFEALASGSLLVTDDLGENELNELFQEGKHLITYKCGDELVDKVRFHLGRHDVRERIAAAGRAEVLAKHTYFHRMSTILDTVAEALASRSKAAERSADVAATKNQTFSNGHEAGNPLQDLSYFEFARPEIVALVPSTARRVLDIGCSAGRLGEALKARQPCEVIGIELHAAAAAAAQRRLDQVILADVQRLESLAPTGTVDAAILADLIEHLADPVSVLRRVRASLGTDGVVTASIPNVRHHSVLGSLLDGNWTYEPAGLLDTTHLRFFTRPGIERLFREAGFEIQQLSAVPGQGYDEWRCGNDRGSVRIGHLLASGLKPEDAEEFFIYQWLVVAAPAGIRRSTVEPQRNGNGRDNAPPCLVLMVTHNRLDYTKLALEAALAQDYPNFRLVVWDNCSTDGTVEYLRERLAGVANAKLEASPANRGVVYPMNAVWSADDQAQLLAKIDNDTLVPPDLLSRLVHCHARSARLGVLSGFHFRKEGEAVADPSQVRAIDGVSILPQHYVGGCAVMIRRDVYQRLGPIACRTEASDRPFMDAGWTNYQQRIEATGLINGYPWPPIHVDHMEDTRSPRCIKSAEHEGYKQALRGMSLSEFTEELCVWRPHSMAPTADPMAQGPSGAASATAVVAQPMTRSASRPQPRMHFSQDFQTDFDQFDFRGEPFAFVRYGDGERGICMSRPVKCTDGWTYDGRPTQFGADLNASLEYVAADYYIGISDGCCDRPARDWFLSRIKAPLSQVTFANIFVNGNYRRFRQCDLSGMVVVASEGGDISVPEDIQGSRFDLDRLVELLLTVDRPMLIAAGPASGIIIHKYWQRAKDRQVIVDVGSAIDEWTKGRKTRQYQFPGTRTAELICTW